MASHKNRGPGIISISTWNGAALEINQAGAAHGVEQQAVEQVNTQGKHQQSKRLISEI